MPECAGSKSHADVQRHLDIVFRPIGTWIGGQYAITSPALLVVQSILYSHCEWFHESGWEAHSAVRAHRELRGTVSNRRALVSERHARFIAGIIAHQTLLRASWTTGDEDLSEVYAIRANKWVEHDDSECVGLGVACTLFPFISEGGLGGADLEATVEERQLAAALVLHSVCLNCRHSRSESKNIDEIKGPAMAALDAMLAPQKKEQVPVLASFQYGRYVHAAQGNGPELLAEAKKDVH